MFGHRGAICRVVNRSPRSPFALVSESPPLFNSAGIRRNQLVRVGFANAKRVRISGGKPNLSRLRPLRQEGARSQTPAHRTRTSITTHRPESRRLILELLNSGNS